MIISQAYAQEITNEALPTLYGGGTASGLAILLASLWSAVITLGSIAMTLFFVWGAAQWIMAGGDKGKIESARNRMLNAIMGMAILGGTVAVVFFLREIFGLDLLKPTFTGPGLPGN